MPCRNDSSIAMTARRALIALLFVTSVRAAAAAPCLAPATWYALDGATPREATAREILDDIARHDVVLLGEQHDNADHHRWQLQTLAALHVLRPRLVIGFEAFPRRVQGVLDDWIGGKLTAEQFLERVQWKTIWGFAPELYLPLFEFARLNRIPMLALNVERALTAAVAKIGWDGVPAAEREGVSRPAPPSAEYEAQLLEVFKQHRSRDTRAVSRDDPAFRHFVQSQTTWDRAMAEALARRLSHDAPMHPLAIGIVGTGHVQHGYGIAHQLRDLGVTATAALLPLDASAACEEIEPRLADAIYTLPKRAADTAPSRVGVAFSREP